MKRKEIWHLCPWLDQINMAPFYYFSFFVLHILCTSYKAVHVNTKIHKTYKSEINKYKDTFRSIHDNGVTNIKGYNIT